MAETMTTVHDVLRMIRETSVTNHERGSRFEKLMRSYLGIDPTWAEQFSKVWLWADWPGAAANKQDTGIDLVAQDRETGGFCAIQCKFYEPDHTVSKADIDSFFTASGKGGFTRRMIISTTERGGRTPRRRWRTSRSRSPGWAWRTSPPARSTGGFPRQACPSRLS